MGIGDPAVGVSDGCTGFWWAEWIWPVRQCCVEHDLGGSDGVLLDCIVNAGVPVALAALAVCMMVFWRPVYEAWLWAKACWVRWRRGDNAGD